MQAADAVPAGVLQAGCYCQSCHSHRDTVALKTATTGSIYRCVRFRSVLHETV